MGSTPNESTSEPYQLCLRSTGSVHYLTGSSVKSLGLALTCFSDVRRSDIDESVSLQWASGEIGRHASLRC